jgi:hypothetical protein
MHEAIGIIGTGNDFIRGAATGPGLTAEGRKEALTG